VRTGEVFYGLPEVQILTEEWRKHYNTKRPQIELGYRQQVPETILRTVQRPITHKQSNWTAPVGLLPLDEQA